MSETAGGIFTLKDLINVANRLVKDNAAQSEDDGHYHAPTPRKEAAGMTDPKRENAAKFDELVYEVVKAGYPRFAAIVRHVYAADVRPCPTDERSVDRALQRLRRKGRIKFVHQAWRCSLPEDPQAWHFNAPEDPK